MSAFKGRLSDDDVSLTYHLSPGTPATAAVWMLLAKTSHPADLKGLQKETAAGVVIKPLKREIRVPGLRFLGVVVFVAISVYAIYSQFFSPGEEKPIPERKMVAVLPFENVEAGVLPLVAARYLPKKSLRAAK